MCFSLSHCHGLRWDSEQPESLPRRLKTAALGHYGGNGDEKGGSVAWLLVGPQSTGRGKRENESCESLTEKASHLLESHEGC